MKENKLKNSLVSEFLSKQLLHSTDDRLDLIIFGASGFIGRCTVLHAVEALRNYSWGVAGRSKEKLQSVLRNVGGFAETDLSSIDIIVADMDNKESIVTMAGRCRVVVNCSGPFSRLGECLIKACIFSGTHYVDISFEQNFSELMQLKYHEDAKRQNVYILSGCGLFSLPVDVGINYIQDNFEGTINCIEAYTQYWSIDDIFLCRGLSQTAWNSCISSCAEIMQMAEIRKRLFPQPLPDLEPKSSFKTLLLEESDIVHGVCVPFPFLDTPVVQRSQYHFYSQDRKRPIQFQNYVVFPCYIMAIIFIGWCFLIGLLAQLKFTRNILLKYPNIFACGFFSEQGPDLECMERTFFRLTMKAIGWPKQSRGSRTDFDGPPTKRMVAKIRGRNPLYKCACACVIASAITILDETLKLPSSGGVFPPGAAFADTSIIAVLEKYDSGLIFEIIET